MRWILQMMRETKNFIQNYYTYMRNGYVDNDFKELLYKNYLIDRKNKILKYYSNHNFMRDEYANELELLKKNYPYKMTIDLEDYISFKQVVEKELETITFDKDAGMYYVIRNERRLYFKKSLSKKEVEDYYEYLAYEQSKNSPHKYMGNDFQIEEGDVIVDIGAAEGIIALDYIDKASKVFLFEYEDEWIEALKKTFEKYGDKVEIIKKYVASKTSDTTVALDDYFENTEINFVKMDVEGSETDVLAGMRSILDKNKNLKCAITAYHNKDDEQNILKYLTGFEIKRSKGHLLCGWEEAQPPFFRTGVIRAVKKRNNEDES